MNHLARKLFQPDELSTGLLERYYSCEYWRCARDYSLACQAQPDREDVKAVQARRGTMGATGGHVVLSKLAQTPSP